MTYLSRLSKMAELSRTPRVPIPSFRGHVGRSPESDCEDQEGGTLDPRGHRKEGDSGPESFRSARGCGRRLRVS